jgi:hypothetical protein
MASLYCTWTNGELALWTVSLNLSDICVLIFSKKEYLFTQTVWKEGSYMAGEAALQIFCPCILFHTGTTCRTRICLEPFFKVIVSRFGNISRLYYLVVMVVDF